MHLISQRARLIILILYTVGLLAASWFAQGSIVPPTGTDGIWFFSSLAALLLGILLVTPIYAKPVDAISYAVAALVTLLVLNIWESGAVASIDRILWTIALSYTIFIILAAMMAILFYNPDAIEGSYVSKLCFDISKKLGSPKAVFLVIFGFALYTFHRNSPREYIILGLFGIIIVLVAPLEKVWRFIIRTTNIGKTTKDIVNIGHIIAYRTPNILIIDVVRDQSVEFGDMVLVRNEVGNPCCGIILDQVGFIDNRIMRILLLNEIEEKLIGRIIDGVIYGFAYKFDECEKAKYGFKNTELLAKKVFGLTAPRTTVSTLYVDLVKVDTDIMQGSLLEVKIGERKVIYQIIDATIKNVAVAKGNNHSYLQAKAQKIGVWEEKNNNFVTVDWLPNPNQPVEFITYPQENIEDGSIRESALQAVGHFPNSKFLIKVDMDTLVTHNTAILGILGIGKSYLAFELIDRILSDDIKVICLDVTNQYERKLADYSPEIFDFSKNNMGSLKQEIESFLASDVSNLMIINPTKSSSTSSPVQISRIVTEYVLDALQEKGEVDTAQCCLVYEEAHILIPEWTAVVDNNDKPEVNRTVKAIMQGRKFGLGCLVITQRTANVSKSILNQCNTVFAFRIFDDTGIEFLRNYLGAEYSNSLPSLGERRAVLFGKASSCLSPVLIQLNDREEFLQLRKDILELQKDTSKNGG